MPNVKCPRDRQVQCKFRCSTAIDHPFFTDVRFNFVMPFAQLWLNVFCLRSQNELKIFHSALQISQWSNVNLLWEFSLTYNGLNDTLISLNGCYFYFILFVKVAQVFLLIRRQCSTFWNVESRILLQLICLGTLDYALFFPCCPHFLVFPSTVFIQCECRWLVHVGEALPSRSLASLIIMEAWWSGLPMLKKKHSYMFYLSLHSFPIVESI